MINKNKAQGSPRYVCFHCIKGSTDPQVCTNCGAAIEEYDFDSAVLMPPQNGRYRVEFSKFSKDVLMSALDRAKKDYFQRFDVEMDEEGVNIKSYDMAYDRLIQVLGSILGEEIDSLMQVIVFELIDSQT